MPVADVIATRREHLKSILIAGLQRGEEGADGQTDQFVEGYVQVLQAAAGNNFGPRDEYLATVVPAIREGGITLAVVMDGMVRMATGAGAVLGVEHAKWLSDFQGDYTSRIIEMWFAK